MKLHTLILSVLVVACIFIAHGCKVSPADMDARTSMWNKIVADGVVTEAEAKQFAALLKEQGSAIDWQQVMLTVIGSAGAFLGTNLYRNKTSPARTAEDIAKNKAEKASA